MGALLLIITVIGQLLYWDLAQKILILFSYNAAVRYVDRRVCRWARTLFGFASAYVGLTLRRLPPEVEIPEQFVLLSNHQSLADIVVLMASFSDRQLRFVAKRELRRGFPAVSQVLRLQRHALIARHGSFTATMREIQLLGRRSRRRGWCPVIFPEGTRFTDGNVHTFHAGAVRRLAESTDFPLLAVAVDGGHKIPRLADFIGSDKRATYRVKPVAVYPPARDKHQLRQHLADAEEQIRQQVAAWQGKE